MATKSPSTDSKNSELSHNVSGWREGRCNAGSKQSLTNEMDFTTIGAVSESLNFRTNVRDGDEAPPRGEDRSGCVAVHCNIAYAPTNNPAISVLSQTPIPENESLLWRGSNPLVEDSPGGHNLLPYFL